MTRWKTLATAAVFAGIIALPAAAAPVIIGYVPSEKGLETTLNGADLTPYTHLMIAFANPDADGAWLKGDNLACMPSPDNGANVTTASLHAAVAKAHEGGRKVLLSIAGGILPTCAGDWAGLAAPGKRDALVKSLAAVVEAFGFDGVDVDIESTTLTQLVTDNDYVPLVAALSKVMKAKGRLLTVATASYVGGTVPLKALPYFDYVGVMSYDDTEAGHEHSSYTKARAEIDFWLGRGVAKDRLVLGLPFYGYGYGTYQPSYAYRDLVSQFGADAAAAGDVLGQVCATCSYVTYNGPATLTQKAQLAKKKAGGVMVWEISQDAPDGTLIHAVQAGLAN